MAIEGRELKVTWDPGRPAGFRPHFVGIGLRLYARVRVLGFTLNPKPGSKVQDSKLP